MIELEKEKRHIIRQLCSTAEGVLPRGAAEGRMGRVWVPELYNPTFCLIVIGNFAYVFGICPKGEQVLELKELLIKQCRHSLITPADERWSEWLEETFAGEFRILSRYAMRKDRNHFSEKTLTSHTKTLPEGIQIRKMDHQLYDLALKEEWSSDFCSNFETPEDFIKDGFGFAALDGTKLVSACSAYGISQGMIQVKVATRREYQRQGLALACSSCFLLFCLEKGVFPSWDGDNIPSSGLAEKLGYIFEKEYQVYTLI
ncbi:GNAT family N-acetyltransferase [Clostridium sp. E02]|uniref:GNAT family N-acetyltransferase n=1 Tax=Clostridium sp. E02 TaxID=2487134 RepID=UPI000F53617A|nr:GNAT family N-acetyltransferase [Clostridium sp. E02]